MKILLITAVLFLFIKTSHTQSFHFPDSNAVWSVYDQKYFVNGDSVYNSMNYKKYYVSNDSTISSSSFYALVREDTILNQVFAIPAGNTTDHLIYDFNLNVHDTVASFPFSCYFYSNYADVVVRAIDSVLIAGQYRKRLRVSGVDTAWMGFNEYWIEGIGSTFGIFNSGLSASMVVDVTYPTLICFEQDSNLIYHNPYFADCYEHYPLSVVENELKDLIIYPNPTNSLVNLEFNQNLTGTITVYDVSGRIVTSMNISGNREVLDLGGQQKGVYFVKVEGEGFRKVERLIVE